MTYDLNNKVVLITGSTGGLGRAAATALRARGARLALLDLDLAAAQDQARALGEPDVAFAWQTNVCSLESLEEGFAAVERHFGRIDVVIANAGIGNTAPLETLTESAFERTIDVNLNGVFRTFKAALPHVKATQGYLLAVSSMAAFVNAPLNSHYAASKAGVLAMCNSLRVELKHQGIDIGTIHPTFFKTPMMDALMDSHCSNLVFNRYQGIWKFVELEDVVNKLVDGIAKRRKLITAPSQLALIARAPGLLRPLVELIGFNKQRVKQAVQLSIEDAGNKK